MQHIDGQLVLSPTDLTKHLACAARDHASTCWRWAAGATSARHRAGRRAHLIFRKGIEHESAYLQRLRAAGLSVVEIPTRLRRSRAGVSAEAETLAAMREGVDVVYQATFFDGALGRPGRLPAAHRPAPATSATGPTTSPTPSSPAGSRSPALLQMATYAERLTVLQGVPPQLLTVVTGDGVERPWRLVDVAPYARRARARLREAVEAARRRPSPRRCAHCAQCRWADALHHAGGSRPTTSRWSRACARGHRQALIARGARRPSQALAAAAP